MSEKHDVYWTFRVTVNFWYELGAESGGWYFTI